jgi:Mg-chelatase subunit ChlD
VTSSRPVQPPTTNNSPRAIQDLENSLVTGSQPVSDSEALLCDFATSGYTSPTKSGPAVLVSETALIDYNLGKLPNCPGMPTPPPPSLEHSLVAYYPTGFPALDHPFVSLQWTGESSDTARADAIKNFRSWLLSSPGRQVLSAAELRPAGSDALPDPHNGAQQTVPHTTEQPTIPEIRSVIADYSAAHEPGRVVFLLDVSWSMLSNGNLDTAKSVLGSALNLKGTKDDVGLAIVPNSISDSGDPGVLVPFGAGASADTARSALGRVSAVNNGAGLYDAIDHELSAMAAAPGMKKQTLVVITDGEDTTNSGQPLSRQTEASVLARYRSSSPATVQVVALSPAACGSGDLGGLAAGLGGHCTTSVDSTTAANLVAGLWEGNGGA